MWKKDIKSTHNNKQDKNYFLPKRNNSSIKHSIFVKRLSNYKDSSQNDIAYCAIRKKMQKVIKLRLSFRIRRGIKPIALRFLHNNLRWRGQAKITNRQNEKEHHILALRTIRPISSLF